MDILNAKFDAELESSEKFKTSPKKCYRPKTFPHSNKSHELRFSVTLSLITFSTDSRSAQTCAFLIPNLRFFTILARFTILKPNSDETVEKKTF